MTLDLQQARRLLIAAGIAIAVVCSWLSPLEAAAERTVDAGLKRALISFATARALNAVISVAQGTEIAVQPAGVGLILSPGQALDPVNDLIEQFSNLMLSASIAFGVEKVLLTIGAHWAVSLALTLTALVWAFARWRGRDSTPGLSRLLAVLLMVRFAVPLATLGSDLLFERFMAADYQASQSGIETVSGNLDRIGPANPTPPEEAGIVDKIKAWSLRPGDFKARYDALKQAAEEVIERIVQLMVIFLLQTLILPLALLWSLWATLKRLFDPRPTGVDTKNP